MSTPWSTPKPTQKHPSKNHVPIFLICISYKLPTNESACSAVLRLNYAFATIKFTYKAYIALGRLRIQSRVGSYQVASA